MAVSIRTIISQLNKSCDDLEFSEARRLIELNIGNFSNPFYDRLLNPNARSLVKHIVGENNNPDYKKLTRLDMLTINNINQYCSEFDISMLRRTLKDAIDLIQREDVQALLNNDAKIVLDTMGALLGGVKQH
ncbi:hypothetical protein [Domibacillus mangrovi]|uniref:Uncharacterized protein n=1 Tax=Domibacillus mangrovi TaxID=1714354 RepID=A0A1Q5NZT2_9BACI|nr:hypothetical protein [Domibacillus mangrovi]OKL35517.1 hypothetical protein BLL40_15045 [Domibacillus mangrovi]